MIRENRGQERVKKSVSFIWHSCLGYREGVAVRIRFQPVRFVCRECPQTICAEMSALRFMLNHRIRL
jgi:hypothetical protein